MQGDPIVILLVEDNHDHADLIKLNLRDHKIANRIYHVTDGEAALDYLFHNEAYTNPSSSPTPHVILLDLRLPKIDGIEVLRTVKSDPSLQIIPVVILTTSQTEKDVVAAYAANANSYLVKPINYDDFTQLMRDLGFYWLLWNRHTWN